MKLAEYQRALVRLGFGEEGGDPGLPGFGLYREMVRAPLLAMARRAYARTLRALGDAAFDRVFSSFLAAEVPASRFLREVIGAFSPFVEREPALLASAPPFTRDLVRFEGAVWRVGYALAPRCAVRELDFEGALVLNPTLQCVSVEHDVGDEPAFPRDPHSILVYRRPDDDDVRWYRAPSLLSQIVARAQEHPASLAVMVPAIVAARGEAADDSLLHELASALTVAVERGVVLGVRAA